MRHHKGRGGRQADAGAGKAEKGIGRRGAGNRGKNKGFGMVYPVFHLFGGRVRGEPFLYDTAGKRYILEVPCYENDALSDMEIRLAAAKGAPRYKDLPFRRQYGYKLHFGKMLDGTFSPNSYFIYLREKPDFATAKFDVLPEGEYLCFRTRLLKGEWDSELLRERFRQSALPKLAVALEFEDNLVDWSDALYEVQMLIG